MHLGLKCAPTRLSSLKTPFHSQHDFTLELCWITIGLAATSGGICRACSGFNTCLSARLFNCERRPKIIVWLFPPLPSQQSKLFNLLLALICDRVAPCFPKFIATSRRAIILVLCGSCYATSGSDVLWPKVDVKRLLCFFCSSKTAHWATQCSQWRCSFTQAAGRRHTTAQLILLCMASL